MIYTLLVLLSGGAFPSLKLMSSNLFGLGVFSAGLSTLQLESFRSHHVVATVLIENVPQLYLQYEFMFKFGVVNGIVIASFLSSIFNILLAMTNAAVFWILHRHRVDIPFSVMISWKKIHGGLVMAGKKRKQKELDPFSQCGKRKNLAKLLGEIDLGDDEPLKFEILSSKKLSSGCLLHGVMASNKQDSAQITGGKFRDFMARKQKIDDAVMRAFGFDQRYRSQFVFNISITRTTTTSCSERAKLVIQTLRECGVNKSVINMVKQKMNKTMNRGTDDNDDEKTSGPNSGRTQNTALSVQMAALDTEGATDQVIRNDNDVVAETLIGLMNQGISASMIRDFVEEYMPNIEREKMDDDDTKLERIWMNDEEALPMTTVVHLNVPSQSIDDNSNKV